MSGLYGTFSDSLRQVIFESTPKPFISSWDQSSQEIIEIKHRRKAMPGRDGTGPLGQGPLTGRSMGCCAVDIDRANMGNARGRNQKFSNFNRGYGPRMGASCGRGDQRGRGRLKQSS